MEKTSGHFGPTVYIQKKLVKFYKTFSQYNFEMVIQTLKNIM